MAETVKARSYVSPRREAQAAETRRLVVAAARQLFERDGYASTSVPTVATEAGVAVKTIYLAFESKAKLLRAVWEARLGGAEEDVPVLERKWFREVQATPDPSAKLRLLATQSRRVKTRNGLLLEVIRAAAGSDDEVAALWDDIESKLLRVQRAVVDQLDAAGALRPDLDAGAAADVLWMLNHPTVWHLLVGRRGWTPARAERWQASAFCRELLG